MKSLVKIALTAALGLLASEASFAEVQSSLLLYSQGSKHVIVRDFDTAEKRLSFRRCFLLHESSQLTQGELMEKVGLDENAQQDLGIMCDSIYRSVVIETSQDAERFDQLLTNNIAGATSDLVSKQNEVLVWTTLIVGGQIFGISSSIPFGNWLRQRMYVDPALNEKPTPRSIKAGNIGGGIALAALAGIGCVEVYNYYDKKMTEKSIEALLPKSLATLKDSERAQIPPETLKQINPEMIERILDIALERTTQNFSIL